MLYGYYDYTPDDPIVQYITEDNPPRIHMYTRDGIYKGSIQDKLIISRVERNMRNEAIPSIKLFLVMVAECFPEKLINEEMPNMPEWHPLLPASDKTKLRQVKFVDGPHRGGTYGCSDLYQYVMLEDRVSEFSETHHLYRLELDPTIDCGYVHVLSGDEGDIQRYCLQNKITCLRNGS